MVGDQPPEDRINEQNSENGKDTLGNALIRETTSIKWFP